MIRQTFKLGAQYMESPITFRVHPYHVQQTGSNWVPFYTVP